MGAQSLQRICNSTYNATRRICQQTYIRDLQVIATIIRIHVYPESNALPRGGLASHRLETSSPTSKRAVDPPRDGGSLS